MAKLVNSVRQITTEDYPKESRSLVEKLAFTLNPFLNSIVDAFNKNLNFVDNFSAQEMDIELTAPVSTNRVTVKPSLKSPCRYILTLRVDNLTNGNTPLMGAPFIEYKILDDGQVQFTNITGLVTGNKYLVKLLLFT